MTTLRDFLREQADRQRAQAEDIQGRRKEWIEAVDRLMAQLKGWLKQADQKNILYLATTPVEKHEESIGAYQVNRLTIGLGERQVQVIPIARNVVGSLGHSREPGARYQSRVDMLMNGEKYMLYRLKNYQCDSWVIVDDRDYEAKPLDQANFEKAILSLLA